mmetsp:Transcript_44208/g.47894  ORF Transcript_44208/g.47894 Transcript_44208/m.47894 type:complete len:259 (+) Transcript_44208:474-1250(+)
MFSPSLGFVPCRLFEKRAVTTAPERFLSFSISANLCNSSISWILLFVNLLPSISNFSITTTLFWLLLLLLPPLPLSLGLTAASKYRFTNALLCLRRVGVGGIRGGNDWVFFAIFVVTTGIFCIIGCDIICSCSSCSCFLLLSNFVVFTLPPPPKTSTEFLFLFVTESFVIVIVGMSVDNPSDLFCTFVIIPPPFSINTGNFFSIFSSFSSSQSTNVTISTIVSISSQSPSSQSSSPSINTTSSSSSSNSASSSIVFLF